MKVKVVVPEADAEGRPLLVFLHGRGGNEQQLAAQADVRRPEGARHARADRRVPRR